MVFFVFTILGVPVSAISMRDACAWIEKSIAARVQKYICVCPVSTIMAARQDAVMMAAVHSAGLVTPDGMPVVWLGRLYGYKNIRRVYGPDLMLEVCRLAEKKGYRHYFYGCTADVLEKLKKKLKDMFPDISIAGAYSPPFRQLTQEEDEAAVKAINDARPDIIWVGLGSPKQDIWMHQHRARINAPLMIGVGAAFDFLAGVKPQAPQWMRGNGLEWLFRLCSEPRRLWRRYLVDGAVFIFLMGCQLARELWYARIQGKRLAEINSQKGILR